MIILQWILQAFIYLVMFKIIMSWLINFQVLNIHQPQVNKIWTTLMRIFEPIYAPIRRVIPPIGGMDFSPLVIIVGLMFLRSLT